MEALAETHVSFCRARRAASVVLLLAAMMPVRAQEASQGLYAQATQTMLDRSFRSPQVEYVLLDVHTQQTIARRWEHPDTPVPVGSLLKPFVALAYGRMGSSYGKFPAVVCHGKSDGCWRPGGHGTMTLVPALAESCNAYFLALARDVASSSGNALERVSAEYGLPRPPAQKTAAMLIGVTPEWRIPPGTLARAYALLVHANSDAAGWDVIGQLRTGMRQAALPGGTAAKVGSHPNGVLAKTGTAPCIAGSGGQRCIANGDGLVMVIAPADSPRWVLLVRQRGTTGAHTAETAGKMLASLEGADAQRR